MEEKRLREQIAFHAARLLHSGQESDYVRAKRRAARLLGMRFRHLDLPSTREIRVQLRRIESLTAPAYARFDLRGLRLAALTVMRRLKDFSPVLHGSAVPDSPDRIHRLELRLHAGDVRSVLAALEDVRPGETKTLRGGAPDERTGALLEVGGEPPLLVRLVVDKSAATADGLEDPRDGGLSLQALESLLLDEFPAEALESELAGIDHRTDRFEVFQMLLDQLEHVRQDPVRHPEGDAQYHSLQVFDRAVEHRPYDEEFLTAALLHDVGKSVDPREHTQATLDLLEGIVTHRTRWLIGQLPAGRLHRNRELCSEERRRLEASADFEDLVLLVELDEEGRKPGVPASTVEEAVDYLRSLDDGSRWEDA